MKRSTKVLMGGVALGAIAVGRAVKKRRQRKERSAEAETMMGDVCRVSSRRITWLRRGKVEFHDGDGGRTLRARSVRGHRLAKGDMVRIVGYNARRNEFQVEPIEFSAGFDPM
ncbi:MAG: NfeD family protein [Myxococcota bacterium]